MIFTSVFAIDNIVAGLGTYPADGIVVLHISCGLTQRLLAPAYIAETAWPKRGKIVWKCEQQR